MVMETDAYSRWRKAEMGATPALMKILSSCHSFADISINSNEGRWRQETGGLPCFYFPGAVSWHRSLPWCTCFVVELDFWVPNAASECVFKASQLMDEHTYPNPSCSPTHVNKFPCFSFQRTRPQIGCTTTVGGQLSAQTAARWST